jgi:aspartate aminotransferase/aminotransferase
MSTRNTARQINEAIVRMPHSGIREIVNLAVSQPDLIRLEIGQPSFNTPDHIIEGAMRGARDGFTGYTASAGYHSLRVLLAEKLRTINGIACTPDDLVVTVGAVGGLSTTLLALCAPGDEVLVPDPAWPNYEMIADCIGARAVHYPCPPENGFLPDLEQLEALITPRTRVLVINTPANPTGVVFPGELVRELVELARRHDLWLVSDEVYDQLIFEGEHISPSRFDEDGRVISVFSLSKTYAMTGWRLGYVVAPREVREQVEKLQEPFVSCAPSIAQKAAEAALSGPQECVESMRLAYKQRRDAVVALLHSQGVQTYTPQGAFYIMVDVSAAGLPSRTLALDLLRTQRIAVAPGSAFGNVARDYVRISLAASEADLLEGLTRLHAAVHAAAPMEGV